ncbi:MAG: NlpC/P60 family protein [Roseburia sp.]|nr:NlpC/P60 family protein [Roseburia sp.]
MKQRKIKLAMLCITAALLTTANAISASASELKYNKETKAQPAEGQQKVKLYAGISAVTVQAAEVYQPELESGEASQEETEQELAVAQVDSYINVRSQPSTDGEIVGKLYNDSVGEIIAEETEGEWLLIRSGNVEGYVKAEYVLRGEEGQAKADEVGKRYAKVTAVTLRVREEATTESDTVTLLPEEEVLPVQEELEGWAKVSTEEGEGYISTEHAEIYTEYKVAESKEEEEARLRREEEERLAARAAARAQAERAASGTKKGAAPAQSSGGQGTGSQNTGNASLGANIVNYALKFVGNPYVYGGTSLTGGADCSGFVQSVFRNFGITLPRTSGEQAQCGINVGGIENARQGDLVCYTGHIGIYIGNGQIVHAASEKTGIRVSNASYRPIISVRRIV